MLTVKQISEIKEKLDKVEQSLLLLKSSLTYLQAFVHAQSQSLYRPEFEGRE